MKFVVKKRNFYFYSFLSVLALGIFTAQGFQSEFLKSDKVAKRVIKCELELPNKLVQNLYYMAEDLTSAKQMLFNSKQGLFFDNQLYIKTVDFNGKVHVVPFDQINCDSVGREVSLTSL